MILEFFEDWFRHGKHGSGLLISGIKTIGDAYMGVCSVTGETDSASDVIPAGIEMRDFIAAYGKEKPEAIREYFKIRVGINTEPVVAGVAGLKKFSFDSWGYGRR